MPNIYNMKTTTDLPDILVPDMQSKWEAFKSSSKIAKINLPQDLQIRGALQRVFALSNFVADSCVRDPALIAELIDSGDLQRRYLQADYDKKLKAALVDIQDEAGLLRLLRVYRRREMIRIAFRDLCGWSDLAQTVSDLSRMADTSLEHTTSTLYRWLSNTHGAPTAEDGSRQHLVVLGLGKLGAQELNFSSDIDLIFTYPKAGQTRGGAQSVSNDDFFTRLCRQLIKVMSHPTVDGFVYRTDLKLRPLGENGPVVMHFDALENYSQEQGREWERYAMIRARVVAGDKKAGERLLKRLNPFIYRRYLDYGAFESLREMKQMISLEVRRKGMKNNIKLGRGGIREIEFFSHMFQLIRGGVMPDLQERSIQKVLKILARENHIPPGVCDELTAAYVFLRNTEHRLQEFADQQTHDLPLDPAGLARLSAAMGCGHTDDFISRLEEHRNNVHRHFQMLLEAKDSKTAKLEAEKQLLGIWQHLVSDAQAEAILKDIGFGQPREVLRLLDYLGSSLGSNQSGPKGHRRLEKLIPRVLKAAGGTQKPERVLGRIVDLIKSIGGRISYFALLLENPDALTHLIQLTEASPWIASRGKAKSLGVRTADCA